MPRRRGGGGRAAGDVAQLRILHLLALLLCWAHGQAVNVTRAWMRQQGYAVLPCANFRVVQFPDAPGCKRRMPADLRQPLNDAAAEILGSGPDFGWENPADWGKLLYQGGVLSEIRIGLTASLSGSLADDRIPSVLASLTTWASDVVEWDTLAPSWGGKFCYSFCLMDDESSRQRAVEHYTRMADPSSGYDVDVLLGPASSEFKLEAARIADGFGKTILLWSYPQQFASLGLGSTSDPGHAIESTLLPPLNVLIREGFWPDEGIHNLYVEYYKAGAGAGHDRQRTPIVTVREGQAARWNHMGTVAGWSNFDAIFFELREQLDDAPIPGDLLIATGSASTVSLSLASPGPKTIVMRLDRAFSGGRPGDEIILAVDISVGEHDWSDHYVNIYERYNEAQVREVEAFNHAMQSPSQNFRLGPNDYTFVPMDERMEGASWADSMETLAKSVQTPAIRQGSWLIQGDCAVDAEDCLTSPNYPSSYTDGELCVAEAALANFSQQLVLRDMDCGENKDKLWITGHQRFYSAQDAMEPIYLPLAGKIIWQSDHVGTNRGWRLCPAPVASNNSCFLFDCPAGYHNKASAAAVSCHGLCNRTACCDEVPEPSVDGPLWDQGFLSVFDITVPESQWPRDGLRRLKRKGASSLAAIVTNGHERDIRICNATANWAARELGYVGPGDRDWPQLTVVSNLLVDVRAMAAAVADVFLLCGDVATVDTFLTVALVEQVDMPAILLARPLGNPSLLNALPGERMNYVLEPLPWPSPEWHVETYGGSWMRWVATHVRRFGLWPNLVSLALHAVQQILDDVFEKSGALGALGVIPLGKYFYGRAGLVFPRSCLTDCRISNNKFVQTLMGNVVYDPLGRRVRAETGTIQRLPLPQRQARTARLTWGYWKARTLLSETHVLVDAKDAAFLRQAVRHIDSSQSDMLVMNELWRKTDLEDLAAPSRLTPTAETFSELVYPRARWRIVASEVSPCPAGCEVTGNWSCRACPPGTYRANEKDTCIPCPESRFALHWAAPHCNVCPEGANCTGDATAHPVAGPGKWRGRTLQTGEQVTNSESCSSDSGLFPEDLANQPQLQYEILSCQPMPWLCLGGSDNTCDGHNTGFLCRECPKGYSWMHLGASRKLCSECPPLATIIFLDIVPTLTLFVAMTAAFCWAVKSNARARSSIILGLARQVFQHLILMDIIVENFSVDQSAAFKGWTDVLVRPMDVFYFDCLAQAVYSEVTFLEEVRLQLLVTAGLLFGGWVCILLILAFRYFLIRIRDRDQIGKPLVRHLPGRAGDLGTPTMKFRTMHVAFLRRRLAHDAVLQCNVWLYVLFPSILRMGVRAMTCMEVRGAPDVDAGGGLFGWGDLRLTSFPSIQCWSEEHLDRAVPVALTIVVFLSLVVPPILFLWLYASYQEIQTIDVRSKLGIFFQGYRRGAWWFDIVLMYRCVLMLLVMIYPRGLTRCFGIFCIQMATMYIEEETKPFVPMTSNALEGLFNLSSRVHIFSMSVGVIVIIPSVLDIDSSEQNLSGWLSLLFEYSDVFVVCIQAANFFFLLRALLYAWLNQVVTPICVQKISLGSKALTRLQTWINRIGRCYFGMNAMAVEFRGRHFTMSISKLNDDERSFLVQGLVSAARYVVRVTDGRVLSAGALLQVTKMALERVLHDHSARYLANSGKYAAEDFKRVALMQQLRGGPGQSSTKLGRLKTGGKAIRNRLARSGTMTSTKTLYDADLREMVLPYELQACVMDVGMDLLDRSIQLDVFKGNFDNTAPPDPQPQPESTAVHLRNLRPHVAPGRLFGRKTPAGKANAPPGQAGGPPIREPALPKEEKKEDDKQAEGHNPGDCFNSWQDELKSGAQAVAVRVLPSALQGAHDLPTEEPTLKSPKMESDAEDAQVVEEAEEHLDEVGRKSALRRQIRETKIRIKQLHIQVKLLEQDHQHDILSHEGFLRSHLPFAEGFTEHQQRMSVKKTTSKFDYGLTADEVNNMEEEEDDGSRSPTALRGSGGVYTGMMRQMDHDHPQRPGAQDRTPQQWAFDRMADWFSWAAPSSGGGGPSNLPVPKRQALPPPVHNPTKGTARVTFVDTLTGAAPALPPPKSKPQPSEARGAEPATDAASRPPLPPPAAPPSSAAAAVATPPPSTKSITVAVPEAGAEASPAADGQP